MDSDQFEQTMQGEDSLMFLYVFDSELERSKQMTEQIINPILDELKGYFKLYAFDCQDKLVALHDRFKQFCEDDKREERTPFFQIIKPAEVKLNPYTKQPMMPTSVPYNDNQVTVPKVKSFILNNLPDFSATIDTQAKLTDFLGDSEDKDINRVLLFSKKQKTPAIWKVLTANFRDRFRFGFVPAEKAPKQILDTYSVTDLPSVILLKTYDVMENTTVE